MDPTTRDFQPLHHAATLPTSTNHLRRAFHSSDPGRHGPANDPGFTRTDTSATAHTTTSYSSFRSPRLYHTSIWGRRLSTHSLDSDVGLRRRKTHGVDTVRAYHPPVRPGWEPGAEPGIDTSKEDEDDLMKILHANCDITVVDFSPEQMEQHLLDNSSLEEFLEEPRPEWASARWICVNGISWDVIKLLGNHKGFHRLAIEDMINTKNRTKADWYSDHCYMVFALAKLVHMNPSYVQHRDRNRDSDSDISDSNSEHDRHMLGDSAGDFPSSPPRPRSWFHRLLKRFKRKSPDVPPDLPLTEKGMSTNGVAASADIATASGKPAEVPAQPRAGADPANSFRTLQRFKAGANMARTDFMESKSALSSKSLAVSVEQVSIFLTSDNTVVSFFEHSAADILEPILARLESKETIIRRASDASMLVQSLIDAIIDLAIPVAAAYDDAIGTLEFEVLTDPDMQQPKKLYILSSELALLKNIIQPITSVVNALRDHHADPADLVPADTTAAHQPPSSPLSPYSASPGPRPPPRRIPTHALSTIEIPPLTRTYLADVEDHILVLVASLEQMAASTSDLTSLIFNMMGAYQNESMKQLTLVTIFFLPLTFLTGYFGQNFAQMWSVQAHSDAFFWWVAVPVQVVVSVYLLRGVIARGFQRGRINYWVSRREKNIRRSQERERRRMSLHGVYGKGGRAGAAGVAKVEGLANGSANGHAVVGPTVKSPQAKWRPKDARQGDGAAGV